MVKQDGAEVGSDICITKDGGTGGSGAVERSDGRRKEGAMKEG